jgi:cytochrome P450
MPGCWDKVHEEIAPAFDDTNEVVDLDHLVNKTPLLNSMYWETMRWTSGVNSVRKVVEDTPIGGYTFLNGAAVSTISVQPVHVYFVSHSYLRSIRL